MTRLLFAFAACGAGFWLAIAVVPPVWPWPTLAICAGAVASAYILKPKPRKPDSCINCDRDAQFCRSCCDAIAAPAPSDDNARDAARWRALFSGRVRYLGSAGLHSDNDPFGRPYPGYAHIGLELWTKHDAPSNPEDVRLLTRYADIAAGFIVPEKQE